MKYSSEIILQSHKHCVANRDEIQRSKFVGCFYCEKIFKSSEIVEFCLDKVDEDLKEITGLCPFCSIDSLLGDASGYEVTSPIFLKQMKEHWF